MQRVRMLMLIPALALVLAVGCSKPETKTEDNKTDGDKKTGTSAKKKDPVEVKATGTVKGKVTFMGQVPAPKSLKDEIQKKKDQDTDHCLKQDTDDPTWVIGADKGVANVVVWVRPAGDKYFVVPEAKRKVEGEVVIDQPFCRFKPAVTAAFPSYYDSTVKDASEALKPTGQKFIVKNSAPIAHNTKWSGGGTFNSGDNKNIPSGGTMEVKAVPGNGRSGGAFDQLDIACNIHPWMKSWALVFDHPYFAVTSGDTPEAKEFGTFEIKDAPAGVELELVYWHPSMGKTPKVLKKLKVGEGESVDGSFEIK